MGIIELLEYGTPGILLALILINVIQSIFTWLIYTGYKSMKDDVVWKDVYETKVEDVERRLERLENQANGKK